MSMRRRPTAETCRSGANHRRVGVWNKFRRTTALAVIALGITAGTIADRAAAETGGSTLNEAIRRGKIIIGTRSTAVPFSFKDSNGALVGFDIDLARELARGLLKDPAKIEFTILTGSADRV